MNNSLTREFKKDVNGKEIHFEATYNPMTHQFVVKENQDYTYQLIFDMQTRVWSTEGNEPSIPVDELAQSVQQSFGVFI